MKSAPRESFIEGSHARLGNCTRKRRARNPRWEAFRGKKCPTKRWGNNVPGARIKGKCPRGNSPLDGKKANGGEREHQNYTTGTGTPDPSPPCTFHHSGEKDGPPSGNPSLPQKKEGKG